MSLDQSTDRFVHDLTAHQSRLYAYICVLLHDPDQAQDVLQETNMVLWRKAATFQPGTDFGAWAAKIAYYEVLAYRKRHQKDRHVFSDDLLRNVADEFERQNVRLEAHLSALAHCLDKLPASERELVSQRYGSGISVQTIAAQLSRTVGAVSQGLYRIRLALAGCVQRTIAREDRA